MSKLPLHPAIEGKVTNPLYSLFRFPCWPDHVNASKVSVSARLHLIDVCRYNFDSTTLMPGSNDPAGTSRRVYKWLGSLGTFQVSCFSVLCLFTIDALDLERSRCDLDSTTSPLPSNESNDSVRTFRVVFGWLHRSQHIISSQVGVFDFCCLTDVSRCDLHHSASPLPPNESNDSMQAF